METLTLTEIGVLLLIGNILWFIACHHRNVRRAQKNARMHNSLDRYIELEGGRE
jgi:hypothetical protein